RMALATFAGAGDGGRGGGEEKAEPAKPETELLAELEEAIKRVEGFLEGYGASLSGIVNASGFERNAAILAAKEAANENDETRKRFEVMCRVVFKKFKASINVHGVNIYRHKHDAIGIVYRSLQQDREKADITEIMRDLHKLVDEAIAPQKNRVSSPKGPYDISKIDFDRLRVEFARSPGKRTTVHNLKDAIETRLSRLLEQNPLRTDFQSHFEKIVEEYNREKDRVTIETTFDEIVRFVKELDEEESRAIREGLDEESLAIFDLLKKPDLEAKGVERIKAVSVNLLETLKAEKLRIDHWRDKEATRDAVRLAIRDFLWTDSSGLPENLYSIDEVKEKAEIVYKHVFRVYPILPSPFYPEQTVA
ncbi:MAG: DUF3387 domain-containing protein, partial [Synergistota bacterium]|nr:DUF3387 domain-containing protein [Synergistota bacterium]